MYSKFGQFIDGKWQEAEKKETYDVINPATEEVIGKASKASSADVQKALKSAEKGLKVWSNTTPWQRSYIIRKIADLMREKKDVLAKWLTLEVGKPLAEGVGEVGGGAPPPTSPTPSARGLPTSSVNHLARTSFFSLIRSAIFLITYDLCHGKDHM